MLYALFMQVADPRCPRGVRHHIATVLTVMVLAVLAGARNFREAGDRAGDLPPLLLKAAGARSDRRTGELVAPSGSTLRRVIEDIDADIADRLVCQWIAQRARLRSACDSDGDGTLEAQHGLAMDGKTVRRSGAGSPDANVKLFSAMLHEHAVVIAQIRVPDATTEVTQVAELLDPVDLAGAVVTGDAAHTQTDTAAYIRGRGADYVLTLKGNQPSLLDDVTTKLATTAPPATTWTSTTTVVRSCTARSGAPTRPVSTSPAPPRSSEFAATCSTCLDSASAKKSCTESPASSRPPLARSAAGYVNTGAWKTRSTGFGTSSSPRTTKTPTSAQPPTAWPCSATSPSA
ncbi:ISAs1 family transposase [Micromonospora sp. DR5-3]|uniref:ISAs1 family transposase n=1 Tax=unclassified Micromonospora TaxID=2617518 RepID=UPI0011D5D315|nr:MULTISPECIES: ISAs1 family transposase [unclassified Micromonospora]MCW3818822.1 ISAs1 family transposase [Micromonospora sp. DR5-3]TYC20463.1 ISAs1 family transposase [Micromonospora sp. MP36]